MIIKNFLNHINIFGIFTSSPKRVDKLKKINWQLEVQLDTLRAKETLPPYLLDQFYTEKQSPDYQSSYLESEPLVSVCIATYNRAELLIERSVKSILNQTYKNFQLIVIGDCCTDNTEKMIAKISDNRLQFENLTERGIYPIDPQLRWMVAGTKPINRCLELVEGDFITHLDDDDEHMPNRLEKLLAFIKGNKADLVWHPFYKENMEGKWAANPCEAFRSGMVTTSSVLYHNWFKCIRWDPEAYRYHQPGDWNRFSKFLYLNAKLERHSDILLRHYKEKSQKVDKCESRF